MTKAVFIYNVISTTGEVRYVGASVNPYSRMLAHISESAKIERNERIKHGEQFHRWLHREVQGGRTPAIRVVAIASDEWRADEHAAIVAAKAAGYPLLNTLYRGGKLPDELMAYRRSLPASAKVKVYSERNKLRLKPAKPANAKAGKRPDR